MDTGPYPWQAVKAEQVEPQHRVRQASYRKNTKTSQRRRPREEWIAIDVPAIIDRETWERAQLQLNENSLRSPRNNKRNQYLLRGLIRCSRCGSTYVGTTIHDRRYYRCNGFDPLVAGEKGPCRPTHAVQAEQLEETVWSAVTGLLQDPDLITKEYERRMAENGALDATDEERHRIDAETRKLKKQEDRLLDAYQAGMIEMDVLKERMGTVRAQKKALEDRRQALENQERQNLRLRDALAALEKLREEVGGSLDRLDFESRQEILRTVLDQVVVDGNSLQIKAVISPDQGPGNGSGNVNLRPRCLFP